LRRLCVCHLLPFWSVWHRLWYRWFSSVFDAKRLFARLRLVASGFRFVRHNLRAHLVRQVGRVLEGQLRSTVLDAALAKQSNHFHPRNPKQEME